MTFSLQKYLRCIALFLCFVTGMKGATQSVINGPTCVNADVVYDYLIKGNPDSMGLVSLCVTGGIFSDTTTNCKNLATFEKIQIKWSEDALVGKLMISWGDQLDSLDISIAPQLDPGIISVEDSKQSIPFDSLSAPISCSEASGGYCSATFSYQWQSSHDGIDWDDLSNQSQQNLPAQLSLKTSSYYRRKVTEQSSGTVAYSNIAVVFVDADYESHD